MPLTRLNNYDIQDISFASLVMTYVNRLSNFMWSLDILTLRGSQAVSNVHRESLSRPEERSQVCVMSVSQPSAYHPESHCWLVSEAMQSWSWSVPGWETRWPWKWCWRASRRHSLLWSKKINIPGQWLGILPYIGSCLHVVTKYTMVLIVRVGVLTLVCWLNSQSGPHTIMAT